MTSASSRPVLWFCSWYPSPEHPFSGIFIRRRAQAVARFCPVLVLVAVASGGRYVVGQSQQGQLTEVVVRYPVHPFLPIRLFRYLKALWLGYRSVKAAEKPRLVQANVIYPAAIAALVASLWFRIPLVVTEHWTGYRPADGRFRGFWMRRLARMVVSRASVVVTESDSMAAAMQSRGLKGRYVAIPNVVDTGLFCPGDLPPAGVCRLLHVSLLDDAQKNIRGILRAFSALLLERRDAELDIIGDGSDRAGLEGYARELGLQDNVHFLGAKDAQDVAAAMRDSHAFLLFSNFEGLPCVLLEALASGLPVIATETGGISRWVDESNGFLLEPGDEAGLLEALRLLPDRLATYDRSAIRTRVVSRCSQDTVGQAFVDLYQNIV